MASPAVWINQTKASGLMVSQHSKIPKARFPKIIEVARPRLMPSVNTTRIPGATSWNRGAIPSTIRGTKRTTEASVHLLERFGG